MLARMRRNNRGVDRQQVRMVGDVADDFQRLADFLVRAWTPDAIAAAL